MPQRVADVDALPLGTVLAPKGAATTSSSYRIASVLGSGGFGITYLADWLGTQVAIKEYLPEDFATRAADGLKVVPRTGKSGELFEFGLERFEEEARTLLQLKDAPSITKALNYFEANDTAYLVMDYVVGRTLEEVVREQGWLPEDQLQRLLLALLRALQVVHARGYLHRDIKPSNILVLPDGSPLLIDFGAARQALGVKTQMLTVMLSPGFAPFEQYNTSGSGPFTDLYALGASIYFCLLNMQRSEISQTMSRGQAPDRVAALQRGDADPLVPAVQMGAGRYSQPLLEVIDSMLRVWPNERPQTAADVLARLEGTASGPATELPDTVISRPPPPRPEPTTIERSPARVWIVLAVVGVIVAVFAARNVLRPRPDVPVTIPTAQESAPPSAEESVAIGRAAATPASTPSPAVSLPTQAGNIEGPQLAALLTQFDLFDARRNPGSKGVTHRYRAEAIADAAVVTDAATGLMWQKAASATDQNTFPELAAYIEQLNAQKFAGFTDWRVPTLLEAMTLLEPAAVNERHLDPVFTGGNFIWTADTAGSERGWVIYFYDGYAASERFTFNASVRAVRNSGT